MPGRSSRDIDVWLPASDYVLFLAGKYGVTAAAVGTCAATLPEPARQQVLENLVYLRILKL